MILAIDIGNSETDIGVRDAEGWRAIWHRPTHPLATSSELESWLHQRFVDEGLEQDIEFLAYSSVVPLANSAFDMMAVAVTGSDALPLRPSPQLGLEIRYDPPESLGADRIANVLGALAKFEPPILVIDIGTATTLDAIDASGAFVGGAIMIGPETAAKTLASATAQLPAIVLKAPAGSIGKNTTESLQSGLVLGYAAGVQGLAIQIMGELGPDVKVVATGGFAELMTPLCPAISEVIPTLTLDGIVVAANRLAPN